MYTYVYIHIYIYYIFQDQYGGMTHPGNSHPRIPVSRSAPGHGISLRKSEQYKGLNNYQYYSGGSLFW